MTGELETDYEDSRLRVVVSDTAAALFVNGVERDRKPFDNASGNLYLSSSVQTGYEWHEFIEATVTYSTDEVIVEIRASNRQLAREQLAA